MRGRAHPTTTPAYVYARLAARLGGVDPTDRDAVAKWYREELPAISAAKVEACLAKMLGSDLTEEESDDVDFFAEPKDVPLPRLCDAPPARIPLPARLWQAVYAAFRTS